MKLPRILLRAFDILLLALAISLISCAPPPNNPVLDTEITGGPESGSITFGGEVGFSCAITSGSGTISPPLYIEASLDGGPYAPLPFGGSDVVYHGLSDGAHTFAARATNGQGLVDPTPATRTWTTDSAPPDTTITAGPSGTVLSNSATFAFSANEATSRFNYTLDSGPTALGNTTSTSLTFSDLAEGQHTLAVEAVDLAGNVDPTPATRTWIVDAIPDGAFGDAFAWGKNQSGQLGDGTTIERPEAVRVTDSGALADKIIVAVAPGEAHNCALTHDGQLFAWGDNQFGQVGDGTTTSRNEPVPVNTSGVLAGKTFTAVAAGRAHNLVLTANGQLFAWGDNPYGQLGDGTDSNWRSTAVAVITSGVLSGKVVTAVAAGADHSVALTSTGELFAWGNNIWGQLGDGTTAPLRDQPTAVIMSGALAGKTVTAIASGENHTLALTSDGQLFAWGNNEFGQLGDGTGFHRLTPVAVVMSGALAGKTVSAIAAGYHHSLALTSDGLVFAWGENFRGQLGDGTGVDRNAPVAVVNSGFNAELAGKTVVAIAAGEGHSVVLTSDGGLFAWGWNSNGQLGSGGGGGNGAPLRVFMDGALLGKTVKGVAAGYRHSVALAFGPEIRVQQPVGTDLTDGVSTVSFGSVFMPGEVERVFTIKNTGYSPLTGLGITIVGDPDFQVTASPTAPVPGPYGSTTFTVRFLTPAPGVHNATLHLASNDLDRNPFDILLTWTALLNSPLLSGLTLSDGTLTPVFYRITNEYTAEVAGTVSSITVTPTTFDSAATVQVNGIPVASGTASGSIPLNFGANVITVVCTAQDGVTSFTYRITVTRGAIFTPVDVDSPRNPGVPIEFNSGAGLSGTVVYANAEPFVGTLDSDLAGMLRTMVVDRGDGLLDFYYQITNASNVAARGGSDIFRIAVGGYDEGTVEVSATYTASIAGITGAPAAFYTSTPTAGKTVRSADRDPALRNAQGVSLSTLCFHNENIESPFYLRSLYLTYGATQGSCAPIDPAPPLNIPPPPPPEPFTLGGVGFTFDAIGVFNTNYEGPVTSAANNIEVGETSHWLVVRTNRTTLADVVAHISAGDGTAIVATKAPLGGPDGTPPETTITGGPVGTVSGATAIFTFTGSDNLTPPAGLTFEASLDGAAFTPVVSPKSYTGLLAGAHTFAIRAIDAAGNPDPTPATRNWTVGPTGSPCYEVLKIFTDSEGISPVSGLIQGADGALYGTTYLGGNGNSGTVFKLSLDGTGFTVLRYMDSPTTGGRPISGLIQATDGALYGAAYQGGSNGYGTVFKLNTDGTGFTVLKHFDNSTTGREPQGELVQGIDGVLYGVAYLGGSNGFGTVFKMNLDGTGFTALKHFDNTTTGGYLYGGLIQGADGKLYGTASQGGSGGFGTVFKLNTDGTGFAVLKHFDNSSTGSTPYAGLMQAADAALYGTTYQGGSNGYGTVFKLNTDGNGFTVLKHLDYSTTGANPVGDLIQSTDGILYGTAYQGGPTGLGTVFKLNPDGSGFVLLKNFEDNGTGTKPYGRLLQATDGNLYGTTRHRVDSTGDGAVFRLVLNCSLDVTPPDTTITSGPSGIVASAAATFTFTGSDDVTPPAGLTFEASLDGAPFAPAASPLNYTGLTEGTHTFTVRATDAAGNIDPTPAIRTWTVDAIPDAGTLNPTSDPNVAGAAVIAIAVQPDGKILLGGLFTGVSGQTRNYIARLNANTSLESTATFDTGTGASNVVISLAVQPDGKILLGGLFSAVDGQPRGHIARLHANGALESTATFNTGIGTNGNGVYSLVVQAGGKILIGGEFDGVNTFGRGRFALLNANGSVESLATFNPGFANNNVNSVALQSDGKILIGGLFTTVDGQTRNHLARLNVDGSLESTATFNPGTGANENVYSVVVQPDGKILLGGLFTSVDGQTRNSIARLNADGSLEGAATFNPGTGANGSIRSIVQQADGKILLGGEFTSVNGQPRNHIARLHPDGSLESTVTFNPGTGADATVRTLALQADGGILLGGEFSNVNGQPRNRFARLFNDAATQTLTIPNHTRVQWARGGAAPEVDHVTFELSIDGTNWLPLGIGTHIAVGWELTGLSLAGDGYIRARGYGNTGASIAEQIAAFSFETTPPDTTITAGPSGVVANTAATFTFTGSDNITPPAALTFEASLDGAAFTAALSPVNYTGLAAGAHIFAVRARDTAGNIDPTPATRAWTVAPLPPGSVDPEFSFNPGGSIVIGIAIQPDGKILIGGDFPRGIARLNADGSADTSFNAAANASDTVYDLIVQPDGKILLGGQGRIARLNADGTLESAATFSPSSVSAFVKGMALQEDGKIVVGGFFTKVNGQTHNHIVRLNANGSIDAAFNVGTGANANVECVAVQADGKILLGGDFTAVNDQTRNRIARLNPNGSLDAAFNPVAGTGSTWTMAVQPDGKILLAGFSAKIARLNSNGSPDLTFTPGSGPNGLVRSIAVQANVKILLSGDFTTVSSQPRNRVARLNANGSLEGTLIVNPSNGANDNRVFSVGIQQDGMVLLGGTFSMVNGQPRNHLARLANDAATESLTIPNATKVQWQRGGTSPEVGQVTFELSTNGGATWSALGAGVRIADGWERTGLSLPSAGLLRARGRTTGGNHNGSSGLVERVQPFDFVLAPPSMLLAPPPLSPIELWRTQIFGANANNPVISGDLADPDFDGSPNLLEYAFGTDPLNPNSVPRVTGWAEIGSLNFLYQKPVAATDLIYLMEESTDLKSWNETPYSEQVLSVNGATQTVKVTIPFNYFAPIQPRLFLRTKVILAP